MSDEWIIYISDSNNIIYIYSVALSNNISLCTFSYDL